MSDSLARQLATRLATLGPAARPAALRLLATFTPTELAALLHDWRELWARPKQLIPPGGRWRSHGFLTARAFGKTRAIAEFVTAEAMAGRAARIALMAQNEEKTHEVMINGKSGLIAVSRSPRLRG